MSKDSYNELMQEAINNLTGEFETITVIVTRHDFVKDQTERWTFNHGNRYACEGALRESVEDLGSFDFMMFGGSDGEEEEG